MGILKDHEIIPDIEKNRHSYDGDSWKLSNKVFIALHSRGGRRKVAPPKNLTRWILKTSKGFTRVGLTMISKSVRAYVYLLLTSQVQARLKIKRQMP